MAPVIANTDPDVLLRIEGVSKIFDGVVKAVDNVSLSVSKGEIFALVGSSGCGKSTFLKCLLGFEEPAAGEIEVLGARLSPSTVWSLRRQVAWVPQEPELGDGTAWEFLSHLFRYRANRGLSGRLARAGEMARSFLLDGSVLNQPVTKLSGGEKQRVVLIAALLLDRPLLLLDEPFSALDRESRRAVIDHLSQLSATVICVSHEPVGFPDGEQAVALAPPGGRRGD